MCVRVRVCACVRVYVCVRVRACVTNMVYTSYLQNNDYVVCMVLPSGRDRNEVSKQMWKAL